MPEKSVNRGAPPDPGSWEDVATRIGADLFLDLQPDLTATARGRSARRRRDLAHALRAAISSGRLVAGTRLPPYRSLAADLGLARGTVASVYQELIAEGWLTARAGSGTRVADGAASAPDPSAPDPSEPEDLPGPDRRPTRFRHDFSMGQPNAGLFPRPDWIRATRRAVSAAPDQAFGPAHPQGRAELRLALSNYLARVRGVRTSASSVVLGTGVQSAMELLSRTVFGDAVAMESHGLPFHRHAVERGGTRVLPLPIDDGGAVIDILETMPVSAVVLTPSHQFPTGVVLQPDRRRQVVDWARRTGAVIVEDDYDGEFRYDREPVGALQALGPDVVIHAGSVSKSLSPAVRIGWLALPPHHVDTVLAAKGLRETDAGIIDQLVLADLIASGAYDRHIRRSRQQYRERRDAVMHRLADIGLSPPGVAAGLHLLIPVDHAAEPGLVHAARVRGIALTGLDLYRHPDADRLPRGGVTIGFGTPAASEFTADLDALADLLDAYLPKRRLRAE